MASNVINLVQAAAKREDAQWQEQREEGYEMAREGADTLIELAREQDDRYGCQVSYIMSRTVERLLIGIEKLYGETVASSIATDIQGELNVFNKKHGFRTDPEDEPVEIDPSLTWE